MDRSGDASASVYEICAGGVVHIHYRSSTEKSAEFNTVTYGLTGNWYESDGRRFVVESSDGHLIRDDS